MSIETGQFLRLQIPARARTLWLSPAWAVVCGIVASGAFAWSGRDVLIGALVLLLADGAWATVWWGLIDTDWSQLLSQWNTLDVDQNVRGLPFSQPGSPADRVQRRFARLAAGRQMESSPQAGSVILSVIFSTVLSLMISAVIGWQILALSVAAFALTQIGWLVKRMRRSAPNLCQGLLDVGLAWTLGQVAFSTLNLLSLGVAVLFAVAYGAALDLAHGGQSTRRWLLAQLLVVIVLVILKQPLAAFALIAVLVAQSLLATVMHSLTFARAAQFWLMAAMLITAFAIR